MKSVTAPGTSSQHQGHIKTFLSTAQLRAGYFFAIISSLYNSNHPPEMVISNPSPKMAGDSPRGGVIDTMGHTSN